MDTCGEGSARVCVGGGYVGDWGRGFKKLKASRVREKLEAVEKKKVEQKMDKNLIRPILKSTQIIVRSTLFSTQKFARSTLRNAKIM